MALFHESDIEATLVQDADPTVSSEIQFVAWQWLLRPY